MVLLETEGQEVVRGGGAGGIFSFARPDGPSTLVFPVEVSPSKLVLDPAKIVLFISIQHYVKCCAKAASFTIEFMNQKEC